MQEPTQDDWFLAANDAWDAGAHKKALSLFLKAAAAGETHALNSVGYFPSSACPVSYDRRPAHTGGRRERAARWPVRALDPDAGAHP